MRNQNSPMTMEEIRNVAPSAFATTKFAERSDRYAYIPTVNVIEGMLGAGFQVFQASQSRAKDVARREYTKHMIRFRNQEVNDHVKSLMVPGTHNFLDRQRTDTVFPEVVMINSHDGTSTYQLMAGFFRLVCSNGLIVADAMIASIRIMHVGNIVDQVVEGSQRIVDGLPKAIDQVNQWRGLMLTDGEQNIFAEAVHEMRFADDEGITAKAIEPKQLLAARRTEDVNPSLWNVVNRVQENVIQGGLRGRGIDSNGHRRRVKTRGVNGIDQDVKLNRAIWTLAEKMAELKGATD